MIKFADDFYPQPGLRSPERSVYYLYGCGKNIIETSTPCFSVRSFEDLEI